MAYDIHTDFLEGKAVTVNSLRLAIESETQSLQQIKDSLQKEISDLESYLKYGSYSKKDYQRSAYTAALREIGGNRLQKAKQRLRKSKKRLKSVAAAIGKHNQTIQDKGLIKSLFSVIADNRNAKKLSRLRESAMSDYNKAFRYWNEVVFWINEPEQVIATINLSSKKLSAIQSLMSRHKDMNIRLRQVQDDIEVRNNIRARLAMISGETQLIVHHSDLDKAINDPFFTTQLSHLSS